MLKYSISRGLFFLPSRVGDLFHLPILEVDHRAGAEEVDDRHELIALPSLDDLALDAREWSAENLEPRADGDGRNGDHRESRGEHSVNLPQVMVQRFLAGHFQDANQAVPFQRQKALAFGSEQKDVAREQGDDRPGFSPLRSAILVNDLRQVIGDILAPKVASGGLFLSGFRV